MQIKCFEADDMTEALRKVKREFGDDAVILSAKEARPGGFFSAFKKKCVEITAATDYPLDDAAKGSDFSKQLSLQLDTESEKDRVSLSSKPTAFVPLDVSSKRPEASAGPSENSAPTGREVDRTLDNQPVANDATIASERAAGDERLQPPEGNTMTTATPFYRHLSQRRIIALVGAHGTGKSTAVAKLARHCCLVEKKSVALISLDRFRIGATSSLEKVSEIMNLPFTIARDADQLFAALKEWATVDIILLDTPGIGQADTEMVDDIAHLLETAKPDETHLVVNATARRTVLDTWAKTLQPLGIDHLLVTHVDEYGIDDGLVDLIKAHRLPSAFYTDGVDLFDHLHETDVDRPERSCTTLSPKRQRVTDFPTQKGSSFTETTGSHDGGETIQFVANRNSELFHHPNCKSIKRINTNNITAFSSIEQAMEEGFKPCRACCKNEVIKKTAPGVFAHRRLSAI